MLRRTFVKQITVDFGGAPLASVGTTVTASASFSGMTSSDGVAWVAVPALPAQISGPTFIIVKDFVPGTDSVTVTIFASGGPGTANNVIFNVTRFPK